MLGQPSHHILKTNIEALQELANIRLTFVLCKAIAKIAIKPAHFMQTFA